jgi:hypothetical protein
MNMKRSLPFFLVPLFFCVPIYAPASASEVPAHDFIGASKCAICHKQAKTGNQYGVWLGTKHAKALESLATPEAKEIGSKLGIDDPQKSGKCLKCHSTAYWFSETKVVESIPVAEGVSCESCHGPGKDYMKMSVMKNRDAAVAAGLVIPDEKTCRLCHNEEAPTFKGFDFKERWEKIKHPIPPK